MLPEYLGAQVVSGGNGPLIDSVDLNKGSVQNDYLIPAYLLSE